MTAKLSGKKHLRWISNLALASIRNAPKSRILSFFFAIIMVLLGIFTRPQIDDHLFLHIIHASLFAAPLVCQFFKQDVIRIYGIWLGVFLILHGYISTQIKPKIVTQNKNMQLTITIDEGLPGIKGVQQITTDKMGFRSTKPINYMSKDANTYRIFAIGASTTEQIYLDDQQTWTHLLQQQLQATTGKDIEVINTGVSGVRAEQNYETLKTILKYQPDMAIFLTGINDWNRQIHDQMGGPPKPKKERFHKIKKLHGKLHFEKSLLGRMLLGYFSNKGQQTNVKHMKYEGKYDKLRGSLFNKPNKEYRPQKISTNYQNYMSKISTACKTNNLKCVFLSQPHGYQDLSSPDYQQLFWMTPPYTDYSLDLKSLSYIADFYNQYLVDFANNNQLESCNLAQDIPPSSDYMYDECHFNIQGAKLVAHSLHKCLRPMVGLYKQQETK